MDKSMKDSSGEKETSDRSKTAGRNAPVAGKPVAPAQEIADDEVEIAETGGKPEEGSRK
jgi:hypothetical protein